MFLSLNIIQRALLPLTKVNPFFGMTYLAFKSVELPVGSTKALVFNRLATDFLDAHYRPSHAYAGYFVPFKTSDKDNRWTKSMRYPSTSLHRITKDSFRDALIHPVKSDWGWQADYVSKLQSHLGSSRLPAFALAVWIYRGVNLPQGVKPQELLKQFFFDFKISDTEIDGLFDSTTPEIGFDWLIDQPPTEAELLRVIGYPPGAEPEEGAALRYLEIQNIGPATAFEYEPGDRLNIITGDNSLGKTFILDCIWWSLTGEWLEERPLLPREEVAKRKSSISFTVSTKGGRSQQFTARYDWNHQTWTNPAKRDALPGLVIYARFDGAFAVWDPARLYVSEKSVSANEKTHIFLSRQDIWDGIASNGSNGRMQWICNGLLRDVVTWQTSGSRYYEQFKALSGCLDKLSPSPEEPLLMGEPTRLPFDAREIPTLRMPYGQVPVVHASAGVQRVLALAYTMVWAWYEHLANSAILRREPQRRMVLIMDEVEAHLHPRWQRVIVPALMEVVAQLSSEVLPQVYIATHSPLVMASVETIFNKDTDDLHHLALVNRQVVFEELPFVKRGGADMWLMSDVFGLSEARSVPAEDAINDAKTLQLEDDVSDKDVQNVNSRLVRFLAPDDDFWPRWRFFAIQHGVP